MATKTKLAHLLAGMLMFGTALLAQAAESPLTLDVYNPGDKAIFQVSSTLVASAHDAVLIDTQFAKSDATALVDKIRASG